MKTFDVRVEQLIRVTLDETKFTPEFFKEFTEGLYPYDTLEKHAKHLAQLHARGLHDMSWGNEFVEGYGPVNDFSIKAVALPGEGDETIERSE